MTYIRALLTAASFTALSSAAIAATNRILDRQSGPAVLVGHSYGGAVITEAGNNAHVVSLVYVAAFAPDEGEKLGPLLGSIAPAQNSIAPTADGYLLIDQAKFPADFAADVPVAQAQFMAICRPARFSIPKMFYPKVDYLPSRRFIQPDG